VLADFAEHPVANGLQIWFEPGKFLVSECGYLLANVNVIKETGNTTFVGLDTGLNHLIRPMFYDAYHEIENISNPDGPLKTYNVVGNICETDTVVGNICETDTFATDRQLNEVRENDTLLFHNAGAYGFEMSSNFNSRFKPAEVMVKAGKASLIRRKDNWEDLLKNQVI